MIEAAEILYRHPLHLSSFTLDEFECALRHSDSDIPCALLGEIHATLIYNLRTVTSTRHSALLSLLRQKEADLTNGNTTSTVQGVTLDMLSAAMADFGNNWERVPLRAAEGREGWEEAMLGCLKDVGIFFTKSSTMLINYHSTLLLRISPTCRKSLLGCYLRHNHIRIRIRRRMGASPTHPRCCPCR